MLKIVVVNNAEPGITEFVSPIQQILKARGATCFTIEYRDCTNFDFNDVDGVILSGSPQGDDIVAHHANYFSWIKYWNKPILGICAGHHITAYLYGATVLRSEEPESGDFEVNALCKDLILKGLGESFVVKQMHNDSVTLPENFELLATASSCLNQIMKHKHKPLYTCQFHPEYYNPTLFKNFISICASNALG